MLGDPQGAQSKENEDADMQAYQFSGDLSGCPLSSLSYNRCPEPEDPEAVWGWRACSS